jgi:hypothetical protein
VTGLNKTCFIIDVMPRTREEILRERRDKFRVSSDPSHSAKWPWRAKRITYISRSRIFSALEVAGDVFSRADVGQQLVELRRRAP